MTRTDLLQVLRTEIATLRAEGHHERADALCSVADHLSGRAMTIYEAAALADAFEPFVQLRDVADDLLSLQDLLPEEQQAKAWALFCVAADGLVARLREGGVRPPCEACGCDARYHVLHRSTGLRPCNAFAPRARSDGEADRPLFTDSEGRTWRPCLCQDYRPPLLPTLEELRRDSVPIDDIEDAVR